MTVKNKVNDAGKAGDTDMSWLQMENTVGKTRDCLKSRIWQEL